MLHIEHSYSEIERDSYSILARVALNTLGFALALSGETKPPPLRAHLHQCQLGARGKIVDTKYLNKRKFIKWSCNLIKVVPTSKILFYFILTNTFLHFFKSFFRVSFLSSIYSRKKPFYENGCKEVCGSDR